MSKESGLAQGDSMVMMAGGAGVASADEITPEIQALADGLEHDPLRIFQYVHNHIDYVHYYGVKKGAALTLIEGSGNDFDQCALLAALLKASGYEPLYKRGTMAIPHNAGSSGRDLRNWLGHFGTIDQTRNFIYYHGTPDAIRVGGSVQFDRVWIEVSVGGALCKLDPSFKKYSEIAGIGDLHAAMGYSGEAALSNAVMSAAGGDPGQTAHWTRGLDYQAVADTVRGCASNLLNYIRVNYPNATPSQIVSGRVVMPVSFTSLPQTLEFPASLSSEWNYGAMPTNFAVRLRIQFGNVNHSMYTAELQGKRLALDFTESGGNGKIWLDDIVVATESGGGGGSASVYTEITHPGAFGTQGSSKPYFRGYRYAMLYGFDSGAGLLEKRQRQLEAYKRQGLPEDSRQIVTETLNILGLQYARQMYQANRLIGRALGVIQDTYHVFGRFAQEKGFFVDVPMFINITMAKTGDVVTLDWRESAVSLLAGSALEHGVIRQMQGAELTTISTVQMMHYANSQNQKLFYANQANYTNLIRPYLVGYSGPTLSAIDSGINGGQRGLLTEQGANTIGDWTGTAYMLIRDLSGLMAISGGYNGGYNTSRGNVSVPKVSSKSTANPSFYNLNKSSVQAPVSIEPVDMLSGAYLYDASDISVGGAEPRGLSLTRHYSTLRRDSGAGRMGYGWTHSLDMKSVLRSSTDAALGERTPQDMASFLAAMIVARDLWHSSASAKSVVAACLAVYWGVDQLVDNAVSIQRGKDTLEFIRLPDGSFQPPPGSTASLSTNASGAFEMRERHGNTYNFGASSNRVAWIEDPDGKRMVFTYSGASSNLTQVADAYNRTFTFNYGAGNRISTVTDSTGRSVGYTYSAGGDLIEVRDPDNFTHYFDYFPTNSANVHRISQIRDSQQRVIGSNVYDSVGRVIEQYGYGLTSNKWLFFFTGRESVEVNPVGGRSYYAYDARGRTTRMADPEGWTVDFEYDGQDHRLRQITVLDGGLRETNSAAYDGNHNVLAQTSAGGNTVQFHYDALHRLDWTLDAESNKTVMVYNGGNLKNRPDSIVQYVNGTSGPAETTLFTYYDSGSAAGQLHTATDPGGIAITYAYDDYGQPRTVSRPGESGTLTHQTFYSARGDLDYEIDPRGVTTDYAYNNRRLVTQTVFDLGGPDQAVETRAYDGDGNLVSATDPSGVQVRQTWSPMGKPLKTFTLNETQSESDDPFTENVYDSRDWLEKTYTPMRRLTQIERLANDRVRAITDPLNRTVRTTYNRRGEPVTVTGIGGPVVKSERNLAARTETVTDAFTPADPDQPEVVPGGTLSVVRHMDRNGRPVKIVNRKGNDFEMDYDGRGRQTDFFSPLNRRTQTAYNSRGLVERVTEPSSQETVFQYHPQSGRLLSVSDDAGTNSFTYDGNGNVLTVSQGASVVTRTYDRLNRVTSVTGADGSVVGYEWHTNGSLKRLVYPDGDANPANNKSVSYDYYRNGQLKSVTDWSNRVTSFSYDVDGRLTEVLRPNGTARTIAYDAASQVRSIADRTASGEMVLFRRFEYDDRGNLWKEVAAPLPGDYGVAAASLQVDADNKATVLNGQAMTYDLDGNLTADPVHDRTMAWDARNRLVAVTNAGQLVILNTYDPEGNRVAAVHGSDTNRYVVDTVGGLPHVLIREKNGVKTHYVHAGGVLLYQEDEAGGIKVYHGDARGSTVAISDGTGEVTDRIDYSAYGQVAHRTGTTDTPYLFVGTLGVESEPAGLLRMRARYYSPEMGRFLSEDPIGLAGGLNVYAYASANPVMLVDRTGNAVETAWDVANLVIGAVSLGQNIKDGNVGWAIVDGVGLTYDLIATIVPFLPGGASAGLKALRAGARLTDAAHVASDVMKVADFTHDAAKVLPSGPLPRGQAQRLGTELHDAADRFVEDTLGRNVINAFSGVNRALGGPDMRWADVPGVFADVTTTAKQWERHLIRDAAYGDGIAILYERGAGVYDVSGLGRLSTGFGVGSGAAQQTLSAFGMAPGVFNKVFDNSGGARASGAKGKGW